ncbi:sce7726 family protein [Fuerstiella marisgermanici]|uniref:Sce7726 family protein n=1 Tax=Fuerstiella marisgermanici TaxID=1891926 RepID=A0A1P8WAK2_9PLAN|nr:sce7726 family protein [Fuerstiella marisgermanici]APZ91065.1 hypothetical protein Fuma_00651 [Fuerstiella marisgermanici]
MNNAVGIEPVALARFFSSAVLKELAGLGRSPTLTRLISESRILDAEPNITELGHLFDCAFSYLRRTCNRHEYVYKAAITRRVLLGEHNLNTASMLTEFRVGRCIADVVILNGTATAYEVKSERDNLARLPLQIEEYLRVFATVNVIAGENHLEEVLGCVPDAVGILKLSKTFRISPVREGINDAARTCPNAIFEAMTLREAAMALKNAGVSVPVVPNTQKYEALRSEFVRLDSVVAHGAMVDTLKKSRTLKSLKSFVSDIPESLHCASLSTRLRKRDHANLIAALKTPVSEAIGWS